MAQNHDSSELRNSWALVIKRKSVPRCWLALFDHFSSLSFDRQNNSLLILWDLRLVLSSMTEISGTVSNFSLLPCEDPGINRFRLAKLALFHACWLLERDVDGTIIEAERCSIDDLVPALLENLGSAPLEILSLSDGRSSLEARSTKSGLNSAWDREGGDRLSKEMWSASGEDIIEAEVVRPSVDEAYCDCGAG